METLPQGGGFNNPPRFDHDKFEFALLF